MDLTRDALPFDTTAVTMVVGTTILLTVALFGILAIITNRMAGYGTRLPLYALGGSILFVILVFKLEERRLDGRTMLLSTVSLALIGAGMLFLVGEGVVYLVSYPREILATRVGLYLLSLGVVCTGLVYWGLSHWREFVSV